MRLTRVKSRYVVAAAGADHDPHRPDPQGRRDRRGHPAPGARRRRPGDVRDGRGGRLPDAVAGRLPRPPQRRHRGDQRRPGDVRHRAARRGQGVPDWAQIILGSGITLGSSRPSASTSCSTTSARAMGRPSPGSRATWCGSTRSTRWTATSSCDTFSAPVPGSALGGRAGLPARGRSPTPTTCGGRSRRRSSPATRTSSEMLVDVLPRPRLADSVAEGEEGPDSLRDQSVTRPDLPRREGARRAGRADQAYRERFGFPLDRLRAGRGLVRPGRAPRLGAARELARPRSTPRPSSRSPRSPATGSTTSWPTPTRSTAPAPAAWGSSEPAAEAFNALPEDEARTRLETCLAGAPLGRRRPGRPALSATTRRCGAGPSRPPRTSTTPSWRRRSAGHPRIGERPTEPGHEAAFSRREQSGVDGGRPEVARAPGRGQPGLRGALRPGLPHPGRGALRA